MKLAVLGLLLILGVVTWWRSRSRLMRSVRVVIVAYLVIIGYRIATDMDQDQLMLIVGSMAFFGALWVVSWLVTRAMAR